jgi:pSer/pThr/pTyr-binding forkhead associated (FHA) protein
LAGDEIGVGREASNEIVVSSDQASRRHARIVHAAGGHLLQDLGSTNGTFVNSKQVKEQRLRHGDVIRVASTVMKYVVDG